MSAILPQIGYDLAEAVKSENRPVVDLEDPPIRVNAAPISGESSLLDFLLIHLIRSMNSMFFVDEPLELCQQLSK